MKKKIMLTISTVIVLVLTCALLCACIPSDYKDAADNLEDNGYTVTTVTGKSDNAIGSLIGGVSMATVKAGVVAAIGEMKGDIDAYLVALKDDAGCSILYFTDSADAKAWYEYSKTEAEKAEEEGAVVKKSGKVVFIGTEDSYKAVR